MQWEKGIWIGRVFLGIALGGRAWGWFRYHTKRGEPMIAFCFGPISFAAGRGV